MDRAKVGGRGRAIGEEALDKEVVSVGGCSQVLVGCLGRESVLLQPLHQGNVGASAREFVLWGVDVCVYQAWNNELPLLQPIFVFRSEREATDDSTHRFLGYHLRTHDGSSLNSSSTCFS